MATMNHKFVLASRPVGMARREKLFLTQNTLPLFDRLLDILDALPGEVVGRTANPFFYAGLASRYESERLTEDDRDNLPERINRLRPRRFDNWLSEREWIPVMLETAGRPRRLILKLDVNETNIDYLESASCDEVFAAREREYQESYRQIPALDELCARYGDPANRKIYMMSRDIEGRWLGLHHRETGAPLPIAAGEGGVTHWDFEDLIRCGLHVLQPDVAFCGGLTVCRAVSRAAQAAGRRCVPHCFSTGINLAASLHWMASCPEGDLVEYCLRPSPLMRQLVRNLPPLVDGRVPIPQGPGLGIELDEGVVERFRVSYD